MIIKSAARALSVSALLAFGLCGAMAADTPAGLIKYRQFLMQTNEANMAAIGVYMKDQIGWRAGFADRMADVAAVAKEIPSLFPPGSDKGAQTNAKPEVWTNSQQFMGAAMRFAAELAKLAEIAKAGNEPAFKEQFVKVLDVCGMCHERFRIPI